MLAGLYFCFTWLFAYPALLRFPDHEIPDFYPIFIMLHTWDGVFVYPEVETAAWTLYRAGRPICRKI